MTEPETLQLHHRPHRLHRFSHTISHRRKGSPQEIRGILKCNIHIHTYSLGEVNQFDGHWSGHMRRDIGTRTIVTSPEQQGKNAAWKSHRKWAAPRVNILSQGCESMPCSGFYRLIVANEDDASQFYEGTRGKKGLLKANMAFSSPPLAYWGCVIEFPALRLNGKSGEVLSWSCAQRAHASPKIYESKGSEIWGNCRQHEDMECSKEKHSGLELLNLAKGAQSYGSEGAQSQFWIIIEV